MTKEEDQEATALAALREQLETAQKLLDPNVAREELRKSCLPGLYVLKGREAVPAANTLEWAECMEKQCNSIAEDFVGDFRVSTVFLGLDFNVAWTGGVPQLFETMVFGPPEAYKDSQGNIQSLPSSLPYQVRYGTYSEAEEGHVAMCEQVRKLLASSDTIVDQAVNKAKSDDGNTDL